MSAKTSSFGLYFAAATILTSAGLLGFARNQQNTQLEADSRLRQAQFLASQNSQRATALLYESFWADNHLKFSARARTSAAYGAAPLSSEAQITRAPGAVSVKFISGQSNGIEQGYSQNWFYRSRGAILTPYAHVSADVTSMAARRFGLMLENYAAMMCPPQKLGGREVQVVQLRPWKTVAGSPGPARRVWIDRKTRLTLRIENFNYRMQKVLQSELSDLNFAPQITPATFEAPKAILAAAQKTPWLGEELGRDAKAVAQKTGTAPPRPSWLPPGFVLESFGVHRCPVTKAVGALSRFSDGLNSLTIYAFQTAPAGGAPRACNFGPGTLISREVGKGRLVAVGDLPPEALQKVLESVRTISGG